MGGRGYEKIPDDEDEVAQFAPNTQIPQNIPASPPPSFRSRASSPASPLHSSDRPSDIDRTLEDTFDAGGDSDHDGDGDDDRQQLIRNAGVYGRTRSNIENHQSVGQSYDRSTVGNAPRPNNSRTQHSAFSSLNDGVFANLSAKPERGEKLEEQPPSYEQAAADATPPYWETTILAPGAMSDEVYIDGLPVGSLFSFIWNGMISMAFQLVGFLLTYLLHTTHAARNGSRAGLGITLINYGFTMRKISFLGRQGSEPQYEQPSDPNSHDFDPSDSTSSAVAAMTSSEAPSNGHPAGEWFSYVLLILGWIILIKAVTDFIKARRNEQLILQSPERGLNVPVVAEEESAERVV